MSLLLFIIYIYRTMIQSGSPGLNHCPGIHLKSNVCWWLLFFFLTPCAATSTSFCPGNYSNMGLPDWNSTLYIYIKSSY